MIRRPPRSTLFPYTDALPISQVQDEARAVARLPLHALHGGPRPRPEPCAVPQHVDPDPPLSQLPPLRRDGLPEQLHQGGNLGRGPLPVLVREGQQRPPPDPPRHRPPP